MMSMFEEVKSADQRQTDIVSGYIREYERMLDVTTYSSKSVPPLVVVTCLYYYFEREQFDVMHHHQYISLSKENMMITRTKTGEGLAYLCVIAEKGTHFWRFKWTKQSSPCYAAFGVWKTSHSLHSGNHMLAAHKDKCYAFKTGQQHASMKIGLHFHASDEYGRKCREGDIVGMRLDLNEGVLAYTVNGHDYGVAANIDKGKSYRAFVYLYRNGDAVELLSYQTSK